MSNPNPKPPTPATPAPAIIPPVAGPSLTPAATPTPTIVEPEAPATTSPPDPIPDLPRWMFHRDPKQPGMPVHTEAQYHAAVAQGFTLEPTAR